MAEQFLTPPSGFEPPRGTNEGSEFDVAIRCVIEPDGRLAVVSINGTPLEGGNDKEEPSEADEMPEGHRMTLAGAARKDGYL